MTLERLNRSRRPALLDFRPADSRGMSLSGGGREEGEEKRDQNVTTARSFAHDKTLRCSQTSTRVMHLIKGFNSAWVCELEYEIYKEIGLKGGKQFFF